LLVPVGALAFPPFGDPAAPPLPPVMFSPLPPLPPSARAGLTIPAVKAATNVAPVVKAVIDVPIGAKASKADPANKPARFIFISSSPNPSGFKRAKQDPPWCVHQKKISSSADVNRRKSLKSS
jgi:hypothetical protein